MSAYKTAQSLCQAFQIHADLGGAGVHIYGHDFEITDSGLVSPVAEITLPCLAVTVSAVPLCGGDTHGMMKAEIEIQSQADTESSATHAAREAAVRAVMADLATLEAAFTATGGVTLCGLPHGAHVDPSVEGRAYHTPLVYHLGVQTD